jgi:hypothetical protein
MSYASSQQWVAQMLWQKVLLFWFWCSGTLMYV